MSRIEEIRARLAAATPGPWEQRYSDEVWDPRYPRPIARGARYENAALIAAAPADLAYLLAEIARVEGELRKREALADPVWDVTADGVTVRYGRWSDVERVVEARQKQGLGCSVVRVEPGTEAAVAAERERCARVCEAVADEHWYTDDASGAEACAAAIRRGGE